MCPNAVRWRAFIAQRSVRNLAVPFFIRVRGRADVWSPVSDGFNRYPPYAYTRIALPDASDNVSRSPELFQIGDGAPQ